MNDTLKLKHCPKCGGPIPAEAPQGLCPKCLMAQASIPTEVSDSGSARPSPPTLSEVAAAFPQFEILELIGQGGMGFVFKARQRKLERLVALKILPQSTATDPRFAERFSREGRLLARLNHPNIVTIHDFGQANGFFYLLMEYVDGVNLRQAMHAGRFKPEQALAVVPKICDALQFAHTEGILHRDIKPENILLDSKGRVKIADFGIAKLISEEQADARLTASGGTLGTPHYMAPEQVERPSTVDHRADIYSLGVVFYEMLTGELPLGKFQPPSQKVQVDVRLDDVVLHALEKEPSRRYQQASEVRTDVDKITSTQQTAAAEKPSLKSSESAAHKPDSFWRRFAIGAALVLLAMLLIPIALYFARASKAREQGERVMRAEKAAVAARAQTTTIIGTVTDARTGKPVADALILDELIRAPVIAQRTFTDSNGNFQLEIGRFEPHHLLVAASGYETNISNLVPDLFSNKQEQRLDIQLQLAQPAPRLVIQSEQFQRSDPEPNELDWGFRVFVPPNQLATILFVSWSNGVPAVDPGFSAYCKVGKAGGVDISFCSLSCYRESESRQFSQMSESLRPQFLAGWRYPEAAGASNAVHWNVHLGANSTAGALRVMPTYRRAEATLPQSVSSGHQLRFPLLEFDRPANSPSNGWSGVDLRIFLNPLDLPPIRMRPNEIDMTNYIAASGLLGSMDEALSKIRDVPIEPASAKETANHIETNFYIGKAFFPKGDSITISSVERSNNVMLVTGSYNLLSADHGTLALYITSKNSSGPHEDPRQTMMISKGIGQFALFHPHVAPGLPHLNIYSSNRTAIAELYFGNAEEAAEERKLALKAE
jgi:serine/threonine protein kinase